MTEKLSHPSWYGGIAAPAADPESELHRVITELVREKVATERARCAELADWWAAEYHVPSSCSNDIRAGNFAEVRPFRKR